MSLEPCYWMRGDNLKTTRHQYINASVLATPVTRQVFSMNQKDCFVMTAKGFASSTYIIHACITRHADAFYC